MVSNFMSRLCFLLLCLLALSTYGACMPEAPPMAPEEAQRRPDVATFVPGDKISVRVYGEEELDGEFQIQGDGSIDFPLIGSVSATGLSQNALARVLEDRLGDGFLKSPQVTVVVLQRANLEVSVLGAVQSPGRLAYVENLTLVQAISTAGGLNPLAAPKRVKLTREGKTGPKTVIISLKAITEGRREDIRLRPGDIIFVPESPI